MGGHLLLRIGCFLSSNGGEFQSEPNNDDYSGVQGRSHFVDVLIRLFSFLPWQGGRRGVLPRQAREAQELFPVLDRTEEGCSDINDDWFIKSG